MKYTFEISIAGCNTECAHCYVSGGKAPVMPVNDYFYAVNVLKNLFQKMNGEIYLTIGNENFLHPDITEIITQTHKIMPEYFSYENFDIPTSGIALMNRKDKDEIITALKSAGCSGAGLTLHGNDEHQGIITKNSRSFTSIIKSAEYFTEQGFQITFNLMLNKMLSGDWNDVSQVLSSFPESKRLITIPLYMPTERLRYFQKYRAEYTDCVKLYDKLDSVGISADKFKEKSEALNEKSIYNFLSGSENFSYSEEEAKSPNWAFFNITQNLDIFYGNVGAHTQYLGNLHSDSDIESIYEKIKNLPANYEWSAFYNVNELPPVRNVLEKITSNNTNYIYPSATDCICSWIDSLSIPNILI